MIKPGLYSIKVEDIITDFYPGDFQSTACSNWKHEVHLTCIDLAIPYRWQQIFDQVIYNDVYGMIKYSIMNKGFVVPVVAKKYKDKVALVDGHHRVTIARELDMPSVPVYIASSKAALIDLVAIDSNFWRSGSPVDSHLADLLGSEHDTAQTTKA